MILDIAKLENVFRLPGGSLRSGCPACMANGGDPQRTHLFIRPDGRYGCAANKESKAHTGEIFRIAGKKEGEIETTREDTFEKHDLEVESFFKEEDLVRLIPQYDYWNGRGIDNETLAIFRGGLSFNNKMSGRFCFPIFTESGLIHGMSGRWASSGEASLPWKHLGRTSTWLYPLYFNSEFIAKSGVVILVESIGDMLALWNAGVKTALVLFGVGISQTMMARLVGLNPDRIYIATNNDTKHSVGQVAAEKIKNKLDIFFDAGTIEIKLPPKKDFGIMDREQIILWAKELYARKYTTN